MEARHSITAATATAAAPHQGIAGRPAEGTKRRGNAVHQAPQRRHRGAGGALSFDGHAIVAAVARAPAATEPAAQTGRGAHHFGAALRRADIVTPQSTVIVLVRAHLGGDARVVLRVVALFVLAQQHGGDGLPQRRGEDAVLEDAPALHAPLVPHAARQTAPSAVPAVGVVERVGAGVSQPGVKRDELVAGEDRVGRVALVLDAQVVGQARVAVESATRMRQQLDFGCELNLIKS